MIDQPLVSIIIPYYNRLELLIETLKSVERQVYSNYEIILVDDCSEVELDLDIVKLIIRSERVYFFRLSKNSGPGTARCEGRKLAKGKYIAYLDSDDLWDPQFLSRTVKILESDLNASMVFTNVLINREGSVFKRLNLEEGYYNFFDLIFNQKKYWATAAALWRTEISLSSHWVYFRDHEDYVHDILSLSNAPIIYHVTEALCKVNKSDILGIPRSNTQMLKSFLWLSKSDIIYKALSLRNRKAEFLSFVVWRLSKRRYVRNEFILIFKLYFGLIRWSDSFKRLSFTFIKLVKNKVDLK